MVELTSLEIQDFDLILGMDFLSKYNAKVDCQTKLVNLQGDNGIWERFRGQSDEEGIKRISALKVIKMWEKGAYGYLACAQMENKKTELDKVPVVNEFLYVFPE